MRRRKGIITGFIVMLLLTAWLVERVWMPWGQGAIKKKEAAGDEPHEASTVSSSESHEIRRNIAIASVRVDSNETKDASHSSATSSNDHFKLVEATPQRTRFVFTLGEYRIDEEKADDVTYSVATVSDAWSGNLRGKPQLPICHTRLAVPPSKKAVVNVLSEEWEEVPCEPPRPAAGHLKRTERPEPVVVDSEIYARTGVWPEELVTLGRPSMIRETCLAGVSVLPMAYDFGRRSMRVCRRCEVEILCEDATEADYATLSPNGDFRRIQANGVLNRELLKPIRSSGASVCIGRILYICPDEWTKKLVGYAAWKERIGYEVQVKGYPSETGNGADGIAAAVTEAYGVWGMTHLVLIGRVEELPSAIMSPSANTRDDPSLADASFPYELTVSDVPYVLQSGDDDCQDAFLSRIPVRTQVELEAVLGKLKAYEAVGYSAATDDSWRQRVVSVGSDLKTNDYFYSSWIPPELRGKDDADVVEAERQRLIAQCGFASDSFGFYRSSASTSLVHAGLAVGGSLCNYIGHGLNDGWVTGRYDVIKAKKLTNAVALPFVCSYACLTGNFGCTKKASSSVYNDVHYTSDGDCLAEGFLKNSGGGACGVLGSTNDVTIIPPYYMMMKVDDDVIAADTRDRLMTLGAYSLDGILAGVEYSDTTTYACGGYGAQIARQFHLIGDCSLAGRFRRLQPMTIAAERVAGGLKVRTNRGSAENALPAFGAYVCGTVHDTGVRRRLVADNDGWAVLPFSEEELDGRIDITVYDPLSGLVERTFYSVDADGDGVVSDMEILQYLSLTADAKLRQMAIKQWMASGSSEPTMTRTGGFTLAADRQAPSVPEANEQPFDCRSNPHGRDASRPEAVRGAAYCGYNELLRRLEDCWMNHWDVCRPVFIGESVQGRRIMGVRIGGLATDEASAELLLTGGIHGNERPGVEVALRFAEWLLDKRNASDAYGDRVRALLDSMALYVIPCMNPDGMVAATNASTWGNARENANGIDLNRSYPDGVVNSGLGCYGDGAGLWLDEALSFAQSGMQWNASLVPETVAFMKWCCTRRLTAAVMLHTGAATVCYPYGNNANGTNVETVCPDDALLKYLARGYVAHSTLSGMNAINSAAWYPVVGEAPDWLYRYLGVLPLTVEISRVKEPVATQLETIFAQQWPALLWWMEAASHGVGAQVKDDDGAPIAWARVSSNDEAPVFTDANGRFFRTVKDNEKTLTVSCSGLNDWTGALTANQPNIIELLPQPNDVRMTGRVARECYLPNYPERAFMTLQGDLEGNPECILRFSAESASLNGLDEASSNYWRRNSDGSVSVLFEQGIDEMQHATVTMTHVDSPLSDHRLLLECRTVNEVTQRHLPWVSAARRTFDVGAPAKSAFSLPAYLALPSVAQGRFRWNDGRFIDASGCEQPLCGYWNGGKGMSTQTASGWELPEWQWELSPGWNLVGVPWRMPPCAFEAVMLHGSSAYTLVDELLPGRAYWVHCKRKTIVR